MEMIHLRLVSPPGLTDETVGMLAADRCVFNLVVLEGMARHPDGDALECDVLAGAANEVLRRLRELRVDRHGSVVIEPVDTVLSGLAAEAEKQQLGPLAHAPVWEAVEARIRAEGTYLPSFYVYLIIAGLIGAVGIITNSQILIVAAMVVGPEYGAITSVALGIDRGIGGGSGKGCSRSWSASRWPCSARSCSRCWSAASGCSPWRSPWASGRSPT